MNIELWNSAERVSLLEMHRHQLSKELEGIPESMRDVYGNLEKAFEEVMIAEAKYLTSLSGQMHPML